MTKRQSKLVIGSLLHDTGKIVYRAGDRRNHSTSGYYFLRDEVGIEDKEILDCVRYHHQDPLKEADIEDDALAYITYVADNIAAAVDRRENEEDYGFEMTTPLESVFNILNDNDEQCYYAPQTLEDAEQINYPSKEKKQLNLKFYKELKDTLRQHLKDIPYDGEYINSILSFLEEKLSYIPSSTAKKERADVSLFDHVKMTAAVASCIEQYLAEKNQNDYKEALLKQASKFYKEQAFLLYSIDISGIQDFIYTIHSEGALKNLRARSFYLEILMEHMVDGLLERLNLSRANIIYIGGGHCYLLFPNTVECNEIVQAYEKEMNTWFLENFGTSLYVAGGMAACSANALKNKPDGSYKKIFEEVSRKISEKKLHRYTPEEILKLNQKRMNYGNRECRICKRTAKTNKNNECDICAAILEMSNAVLKKKFFTIVKKNDGKMLPLPGGCYLSYDTRESLLEKMNAQDGNYVRSYGKNQWYMRKKITTIRVGDYPEENTKTFEEYAKAAQEENKGVQKIAVLRADIDNLGHAFVAGFQHKKYGQQYVTLSRTATLSRHLSLFFKYYINKILANGTYDKLGTSGARDVAIVYSGGDDVFLVGAWNQVIEAAVDLKNSLEKYTQNTLTISAGIGIYPDKYPIHRMAEEVAELEDCSKHLENKNAVTLFHGMDCNVRQNEWSGRFKWKEFEEKVMDEKFYEIKRFFDFSDEHGKAFLYRLLDLLRNRGEKINLARFAYLLARLEPTGDGNLEQKEAYKRFSKKMYQWIQDEEDCRQTIYAMYLYTYLTREDKE